MVETLAQQRGLIATFMAKPFAHLTGSGAHFHFSLWRDGENAFERDAGEDPRGLGLSELAYQFIAGLKANAKAYIAFTAPTVNSYKRLVVGAPTSGATWAPAYISYGYNNRTQMLRVPAAGRIEDRTVDGSWNRVPRRHRDARRRTRRGTSESSTRASPTRPTYTSSVRPNAPRKASSFCRPTCSTPRANSLQQNDVLRSRLWEDPRRGLRRLLHRGQAPRMATSARTDHPLGTRPLPPTVLKAPASPERGGSGIPAVTPLRPSAVGRAAPESVGEWFQALLMTSSRVNSLEAVFHAFAR